MKKTTISSLLCLFILGAQLYGQGIVRPDNRNRTVNFATDELLIRFHPNASPQDILSLQQELRAEVLGEVPEFDLQLWRLGNLGDATDPEYLIEAAGKTKGKAVVDETGLNYQIRSAPLPLSEVLKHLDLNYYTPIPACSDYPGTLTTTSGNRPVKIAVIDSGVEYDYHQDLFAGYLGDVYNFVADSENVDDDHGHGTSVTGIIAATLQASQNESAEIMAYKVLNAEGEGDLFHAIEAVARSRDRSANIINISWGYTPYQQDELVPIFQEILAEVSSNSLIVAPAGNFDNDISDHAYYPAAFTNISNMIVVGASDCYGNKASFSSFSNNLVSMLAPGDRILCPDRDGLWAFKSGTSFSVPIVSALAALYSSQTPEWEAKGLYCRLMQSVAVDENLAGFTQTGGTLDAGNDPGSSGCSNGPEGDLIGERATLGLPSDGWQVFPNPFRNSFTIRLKHNQSGQMVCRLFDGTGKLLQTTTAEYEPGVQELNFLLKDPTLPAGIYYLRINAGTDVHQLKMVHLH